ncbi:NeuD/PglB/VioB family sugar acetyltransferase [Flavobacterium ammonificans]|uniref:NeuD/PglB/VioB family sugar acetyltransferase n=1 Tax=Flavobacterium ammonificans TaxID=1751056 RepID=UPI001E395656|nr:NeuD/PglB/VioB family sugar acetyltransferase [Flavobacterium ammonificans]BDB56777.1 transferase [Flavobacterium ammonificans]
MEDIQYNNLELIVFGAGGLAREITSWNNLSENKLNIIGYMDDFYNLDQPNPYGLNVVGKIGYDKFSENIKAICAITNCVKKEDLLKHSENHQIIFLNYIHSTCLIGERTSHGKGIVMLPYSIISCDAIIGDLVFINNGSQIGHDVVIGDFTSIMANVDIGGGAQIGKNVFIGSNAVILPGVKIPDNTIVGAGSVVFRSIKQPGTYFGNPAKKIF